MDISINLKTKIQCDNPCRQLVKTKKPSSSTWASTTSILHNKARSQRQWRTWEMKINSFINKDQGMHTQAYGNGEKNRYSFLTLQVSPPPMLHNGSIYSPQMGNGESIGVFPGIWKAKDQYLLLDEKNSKYFFVSEHKTRCTWDVMVQVVYM